MKLRMIHKSVCLPVLLLAGILLVSCSKEALVDNSITNEEDRVTLVVSLNDAGAADFGAPQRWRNVALPGDPGYSGNITDTTLLDMVIFVFAPNGALINKQSYDSIQIARREIKLITSLGQRRIYAVGNALHYNDDFSDITDENALLHRVKTISRYEELGKPLLFTGSVACMVQRNPAVTQRVTLPLTRMVSRIDVQYMIDEAVPGLQAICIDSIKVLNVPAAGYYFAAGSTVPNYITCRFVPGKSEQQSGRFVFYTFENTGNNPVTIVLFAGNGQGSQRSYTLTVDGNTVSRNKWYKLNVTITGF